MPSIPPFQRLPLHIAETIAKYFTAKTRIFDGSDVIESNDQIDTWIELYNTSYFWRMFSLKHFCREVGLQMSTRAEETTFVFTHLPHQIETSVEYYRYVKTVSLLFDNITNKCYQNQQQFHSETWPESAVFPLAHKLDIQITGGFELPEYNSGDVNNELFGWVAQRIPTSCPRLSESGIYHTFSKSAIDREAEMTTTAETNALFQTVFSRVRKLYICAKPICLFTNDAYFANSPGLVSLEYNCRYNVEFFYFVVHKTALTLERLKVENFPIQSIRRLVFGDTGEPTVYPRLKRLDFDGTKSSDAKVRVEKSVVPFPVLSHLRWGAHYVFEDDTLFRGNNKTLEYLRITFGPELVRVLLGKKEFSEGWFPKLCCVIANDTNVHSNSPPDPDSLVEFTSSLFSLATRGFWTDIEYSPQSVMNIFSTCSHAGNIQVLNLWVVSLTLEEIAGLLRILRSVTDLACAINGVDSEVDAHQIRTITDRFRSEYFPLGRRCLKDWTITNALSIPTHLIITAAVALSALCPGLVRIDVPNGDVEPLQHQMDAAIASRLFDEQAERLQSIFRDN